MRKYILLVFFRITAQHRRSYIFVYLSPMNARTHVLPLRAPSHAVDLRTFNLVMLGKQGWRLMTRPESLCARVLKGRYFHDIDFMRRASRHKRASCTWRAILAGREPLEQGLIRRVVNGIDTEIWRDRWISKHFNARPITQRDGRDIVHMFQNFSLMRDNGMRIRYVLSSFL